MLSCSGLTILLEMLYLLIGKKGISSSCAVGEAVLNS